MVPTSCSNANFTMHSSSEFGCSQRELGLIQTISHVEASAQQRELGLRRRLQESELMAQRLQAQLQERRQTAPNIVQERDRLCNLPNGVPGATTTPFCLAEQHSAQLAGLETALRASSHELASLGRKCAESYDATRAAERTAQFWHRRALDLEEELSRAHREIRHHREVSEMTSEALRDKEEMMSELQSALGRDVAVHGDPHRAGKDLQSWILQSLNEVNRSAHQRAWDGHEPQFDPAFAGREWVNILDNFRQQHQTRIGAGTRTR